MGLHDRLDSTVESLITKSPFQLTGSEARELAIRLGRLAGWILHPKVLEKAQAASSHFTEQQLRGWRTPLPLPEGCGACWVPIVRKNQCWQAMRTAFVLPLRWARGSPEQNPRLPEKLHLVAENVLRTLRITDAIKDDDWQLRPAWDGLFDGPGSELLDGSYDSAWVPLAGALLLAADEGQPQRKVWATGSWSDGQGVISVNGLEEKIELASEHGAEKFFVPAANCDRAKQYCLQRSLSLDIQPLAEARTKPRDALRKYLLQLAVRATRDDSREDREKTYLRIAELDKQEAFEYYVECILDDLAEELRSRLPSELGRPRYLITHISDSYELVLLSHLVFKPERSIIFYTYEKNYPKHAEEVKRWLELRDFSVELRPLATNPDAAPAESSRWQELSRTYQECLKNFSGNGQRTLVLDVTPGTKLMSILLAMAGPPSSWLVYYEQEFDPQRRKPRPFRIHPVVESVDRLRAQIGWSEM